MQLCLIIAIFGVCTAARRAVAIPIASLAVFAFGSAAAEAHPVETLDPQHPDAQQYGWREVWGGADVTKDVWLLYTGVTLAPLSKDIYSDGLRFRLNSGYGQYRFNEHKQHCVDKPGISCVTPIKVDISYADALVGYHLRLGELTAKAFAGASIISHNFGNQISDNDAQGVAIGATAGLEFWLNLGRDGWTSLDLQYTTAHGTGSARWRAGWRVVPTLSIGPETRFDVNDEGDATRAGLFARYNWTGGEISVAAGYAGQIVEDMGNDMQPYVTLNMLSQF